MPVRVQIARNIPVDETTEYVATLKSRNSAVIMPQVEGHIRQIYVHSGDRVETGTPLLEIDPLKQEATVTSQRSNRAAQEANLRWSEQEYQRASGLHSAGVVSKQELDRSKAALDSARAQLESLNAQVAEQQVQLKYYRVEAPSSGIVGDIPVHVGDQVRKVLRTRRSLTQQLNREPTNDEIAAEVGITTKKVADLLELVAHPVSLETPVGDGESMYADLIEDERADSPDTVTTDSARDNELEAALAQLEPRMRHVLARRYGLDGQASQTLEELGADLGITRERVRQLENKALRELRRTAPSLKLYLQV